MRIGPFHGGLVLASVIAFYAAAGWLAVRGDPRRGSADEISGVEREMDHWKT
jgi:hypothetical protein